MKPERAINELRRLRDEAQVASVRQPGPEHKSWRARTSAVLTRSLGDVGVVRQFKDLLYHVGIWTGAPGEAEADARYFAARVDDASALIDAAIYELGLLTDDPVIGNAGPADIDPITERWTVATGGAAYEVASATERRYQVTGHAFISYVRQDKQQVDRLQRILEDTGIPVWRDTANLWPGEDWRSKIRNAITNDAFVFLACFSSNWWSRAKNYQNEELILAIDQLRLRQPEQPWLIPVRFDNCEIPDRDIGGGRRLSSIQHADLFGDRFENDAARLLEVILRILSTAAIPNT